MPNINHGIPTKLAEWHVFFKCITHRYYIHATYYNKHFGCNPCFHIKIHVWVIGRALAIWFVVASALHLEHCNKRTWNHTLFHKMTIAIVYPSVIERDRRSAIEWRTLISVLNGHSLETCFFFKLSVKKTVQQTADQRQKRWILRIKHN